MAHYALLDENNIVTQVITGRDENEGDWETYYGNFHKCRCVRTSYNHKIRGHYAGIGDKYDEKLDLFVAPKPFNSWIMRSDGFWDAPTPHPNDGNHYEWDETTQTWTPA